jgi:hypothetical protein
MVMDTLHSGICTVENLIEYVTKRADGGVWEYWAEA